MQTTNMKMGDFKAKPASFESMTNINMSPPTSASTDVVEVLISAEKLVGSYATALTRTLNFSEPLRFQQEPIEPEEVAAYIDALFKARIDSVTSACKDFQRYKALWVPTFVQFALSCVGKVDILDKGIYLVPKFDDSDPNARKNEDSDSKVDEPHIETEGSDSAPVVPKKKMMSIEEMEKFSFRLGLYRNAVKMVTNAFPRDIKGNEDVMTLTLISNTIFGMNRLEHPVSMYVAAFLNLKIRQETSFAALYRIQYDDLTYITQNLITDERFING